jgi:predicted site-specific integrase-resolvase
VNLRASQSNRLPYWDQTNPIEPSEAQATVKRVAIYVRVSTRDKGQDTTNQLDKLREFCHSNDWRIVREYQDQDSGGKADRQGFQAMLAAARMREFDVVLFLGVRPVQP